MDDFLGFSPLELFADRSCPHAPAEFVYTMEQRGDNFDFVSARGGPRWWNKTWKCVGEEREAIPGTSLQDLGQKHTTKAGSEACVGPWIKSKGNVNLHGK